VLTPSIRGCWPRRPAICFRTNSYIIGNHDSYHFYGVIGFGIMVFIHELGHFGRQAPGHKRSFSWLGQAWWASSTRGTDYRLSICLWGYCKMKGELPMTQGGAEADSDARA
jgi:hypothetical protein